LNDDSFFSAPQLKRAPLGTRARFLFPSSMSLWIGAAIIVIGVAVVRYVAKRPFIHRRISLAGLRRFVATLPMTMDPGGFFIADREHGPGFLQLALREYGHLRCAIEFGLPEVDWSADRFPGVVASLKAAHFGPAVEVGQGAVSRFLRVLIAGPEANVIERCMRLLELVAAELGWPPETTFRVRFGGPRAVGRALERVRARGA